MDEQLENLLKELQKDTIRAFNSPNDEQAASQLNTILTRLKALLATEYDRGYNAAPDIEGEYIYLTEADWKRELKAEYDRGKVDELEAGLKLMQAIGDEQMAAYFESRLKTELKSKGESK